MEPGANSRAPELLNRRDPQPRPLSGLPRGGQIRISFRSQLALPIEVSASDLSRELNGQIRGEHRLWGEEARRDLFLESSCTFNGCTVATGPRWAVQKCKLVR